MCVIFTEYVMVWFGLVWFRTTGYYPKTLPEVQNVKASPNKVPTNRIQDTTGFPNVSEKL